MQLTKCFIPVLSASALFLSSCIQQEDKLTVNSDGTSKFTVTATLKLGEVGKMMQGLGGGGGGGKSDMPTGKDLLIGIISSSEGVDVWKSAETKTDDAGNIMATVSGYAKDVTKLKVGSAFEGMGNKGEGKGEPPPGASGHLISKKEGGKWILGLSTTDLAGAKKPAGESKKTVSDEEVESAIQSEKGQMDMMLPMMGAMLKDMKISRTIEVAGTIDDAGMFEKKDEHTANLTIDIMKTAKGAMDFASKHPKAAKAAMAQGGKASEAITHADMSNPAEQKAVIEAIFGKAGKPALTITPGDNLFDYSSESKKALDGQSAELKTLLKEAAEKKSGKKDKAA